MKLQHPFIQLPLRFDASVLAAEISRVDESAWKPHPQGFAGNSALPLISVNGDTENDGTVGPMRPTPVLAMFPYLQQVLASFGTVLGRSRLMRLSGNAEVTLHVDQGYYWAERMRVHVPIVTTPGVRFYCGDAMVNMAAGECWIFDTWRMHRVLNDAEHSRVHLVVDTVGGEGLWDLIARGRPSQIASQGWPLRVIDYTTDGAPSRGNLEYETFNAPKVMSPWELRAHLGFLFGESVPHANLGAVQQAAIVLLRSWQSLWAAFGDADTARPRYRAALDRFIEPVRGLAAAIHLRNGLALLDALRSMVIFAALASEQAVPSLLANTPSPVQK